MFDGGAPRDWIRIAQSLFTRLLAQLRKAALVPGRVAATELRLVEVERLARAVLETSLVDDRRNRAELRAARASAAYERSFSDAAPLVSVIVATTGRADRLCDVTVASILAQSYRELEVVVVGEGLSPNLQRRLAEIEDARLSVRLLPHRIPTPVFAREQLIVNALAINEGVWQSSGAWFVVCSELDRLEPRAIETLLEISRSREAEVAYGRLSATADGSEELLGVFPPRRGQFSFSTAICNRATQIFEREPMAAELDIPTDDAVVQSMLHAGVRFTMVPDVIVRR